MKTDSEPIKHYLKASQYTVRWNKKVDSKSVFSHFDKHNGKETRYWIPFLFRKNYYLMTFNNCYEVEVKK